MEIRYIPAGYRLEQGFEHLRIYAPTPRLAQYFTQTAQSHLARSVAVLRVPIHVISSENSEDLIIHPSSPNTVRYGAKRSKTPKQLDRKLYNRCKTYRSESDVCSNT